MTTTQPRGELVTLHAVSGTPPEPGVVEMARRLEELERWHSEVERWQAEHAAKVEEFCEAMTEFCATMSDWCHGADHDIARLNKLMLAAGAVLAAPPEPHDPPPNFRKTE